jgi:hypothetical protein
MEHEFIVDIFWHLIAHIGELLAFFPVEKQKYFSSCYVSIYWNVFNFLSESIEREE